jgi:regulatory protein
VPEDAAQRVLDRLTEVGLVDDEAFAEGLVRSRHAVRGLGRRALSQELRRRGVDDETAAHAVDGLDPDEERATALRLARRKLAATRGLDRDVRVRRTAGMLARKGYAGGLVAAVVREALGEEAGTADELTAADRLLGGHEV